MQEIRNIGGIELKKEYINGLGTDNLIAYDVEESANQDKISFCQMRVLPYSNDFNTYGYSSIVSDCTTTMSSSTGITTNRYYYHTNHLGSVVALTNGSGDIVQNYTYDSFGKAYTVTGTGTLTSIDSVSNLYGNTRLYTGREYDREINLYFLRARYYDANIGRFISRDPIGQNDQINLYTYVANSPMNYVDRMGLEKVLIITGKPRSEAERSGFQITSNYQYKNAIKQGIKPENIVQINNDTMTPDEFNQAVSPYLGNIKQVIYIAHGGPSETGDITSTNISQLHPLKIDANDNPTLFLISCQTGRGTNSIAQQLSNKFQIEVTAGDENITVYEESDLTFRKIGFHPSLWRIEAGEPTVKNDGNWNHFYPNN